MHMDVYGHPRPACIGTGYVACDCFLYGSSSGFLLRYSESCLSLLKTPYWLKLLPLWLGAVTVIGHV